MLKIVKLAHLLSTSPESSCRMLLQESFFSRLMVLGLFDWPMVVIFFRKKVVLLEGKLFEGLSDSRSICAAQRMPSHCCPRRNQHSYKSLESWLIDKTEIFRDELSSDSVFAQQKRNLSKVPSIISGKVTAWNHLRQPLFWLVFVLVPSLLCNMATKLKRLRFEREMLLL